MGWFSDWLFKNGFFPLLHVPVRDDLISWYYEAAQADLIQKELNIDNSQLTRLAIDSGRAAENFDENNPLSELISIFDEWESRFETWIYYVAFTAMFVGGGVPAAGVLEFTSSVSSMIFQLVGSLFFVSGAGVITIYKVFKYMLKSSSDFITRMNNGLTAKPGHIRENDRYGDRIVAQFFWNKSLLSPSTHICLLILAVIRLLSTRIYGYISADIQEDIQEFVGMSSREIIKHQLEKVVSDEYYVGQTRFR